MPTFEFTSPDGKSYSVEGPDGATPEQAFQILQTQIGAKPPSGPGIGEDLAGVAKAAPGRIVAGLAGIPGDLLHAGMRALGDNLTPESNYGSHAIAKSLGSDYEAKGEVGRVVQKGLDFLPAVVGGPEAIGAKLLTRVAAPVAASEAGRAVGGPIGEVAGALAGAVGAGSVAQRFNAAAKARNAVPSGEDLLASGSKGFEAVKASDAVIDPRSVQQMAKDIRTELLNDGKHPTLGSQSGVFNTLDRLENMGAAGGGVTPKDLEVIRKNLVAEKKSLDGGTRDAAKMATDAFMSKYSNFGQADILSGSNPFPTLKNAVGDWAAGKRSAAVTGKADLASLNAGTAGSGANEDNALRQAIKQLARPINNTNTPVARRLGFNDPEIAAIKNAATGTVVGNTARYLGKLAPTGSVSGVLSGGAGFAAAGPLGAIGLPAAGYVAKKIGDLSTKRAVAALDSLVRSRSPLAQQVAAQLPPAVVQKLPKATQLLLATSSLRPIVSPQLVPQGGQQER
jgi:hypothetical protein